MEEEGEEARPQMQDHPSISVLVPASETKGKSDIPNTPAPTRTRKKRGVSHSTKASSASAEKAIISRCTTRSQAAPEWTVEETLVLVSEIAALYDEEWLKALPSNQRWKMISENCMSGGVSRSSNLCKRRWDSLLSDYAKVRIWEESGNARKSGSYWSLLPAKRKRFRLPASFDRQVFGSMDAVIRAQEGPTSSVADTDSEGLVKSAEKAAKDFSSSSTSSSDADDDGDGDSGGMFESDASDLDCCNVLPRAKGQAQEIIGMLDAEMAAADIDSGSEETGTRTIKRINKEQEIANKLRKNAKEIHAILRDELTDNASQGHGQVDLTKPNAMETECTRRQADELIKAFGLLVSTLDEFAKLIKDGVCEGSSLMRAQRPCDRSSSIHSVVKNGEL